VNQVIALNKNAIDRRTIVIDDNAAVVTEGKPVPGPSRFTMLVTKRGVRMLA
jgi:hypothetical protein